MYGHQFYVHLFDNVVDLGNLFESIKKQGWVTVQFRVSEMSLFNCLLVPEYNSLSLGRPQTSVPLFLPAIPVLCPSSYFAGFLSPTSSLSKCMYVGVGLPLDRCPCFGSHSTSLTAGSY